jgi:hypothetical protein
MLIVEMNWVWWVYRYNKKNKFKLTFRRVKRNIFNKYIYLDEPINY